MPYLITMLLGMVLALMFAAGILEKRLDKANQELAQKHLEIQGWDAAVRTLDATLQENRLAIKECQAINRANAEDWELVKGQTDEIEAVAEQRERDAEGRIEGLQRETESLRDMGGGCMVPEHLARRVRRPAD